MCASRGPPPHPGARAFELWSPHGERLLDATVSGDDLRAARNDWRRAVRDLSLAFVVVVVLIAVLPGAILAPRRATGASLVAPPPHASSGPAGHPDVTPDEWVRPMPAPEIMPRR